MDEGNKKDADMMGRRDVLKVISTVPAALVPRGSAVAKNGVKEVSSSNVTAPSQGAAPAGYHPQILTPREYKTVRVLSDWIVPADERSPSASQAGVPEFMDEWFNFQKGDWLSEIRGGLMWLDIECNHHYGHDFVDCATNDQKKILDRIAHPETAAPDDANAVAFFSRLRDLVLAGFYSSEVGVKDLPYLGNQMVAQWEGCPADVMARIEENQKKLGLSQ
jgi:hypothetical protein